MINRKEGFIKYQDNIIHVTVMEEHGGDVIVLADNGDILEVPPESDTVIWPTYEECDYRENYLAGFDFIPMGNND